MKAARLALVALMLAGVPPLHAGAQFLLYPFARAFGSPPEAELAKCRTAFEALKTQFASSRVAIAPVFVIDGPKRIWRGDLANLQLKEVAARSTVRLQVDPAAPAVAPATLGHNQLKYLWERAGAYASAVRARPANPTSDYVWFVEMWGHNGNVAALHVYVFDPKGQLAYCRLFNSHHFGPKLALGPEGVRYAIDRFFEDLKRAPTELFPRWGVG